MTTKSTKPDSNDHVDNQPGPELSTPESSLMTKRSSRRTALGLLGVTVTATLPATWTRPVVNSVVLPVHAQTSLVDSSGCGVLTIDSFTITCNDGEFETNDIYRVDDSGDCPVLLSGTNGFLPDQFRILRRRAGTSALIFVGGNSQGADGEGISRTCGSDEGVESNDHTLDFVASSGASWRVRYTLSATDTSVSVTNIVLEPV